MMSSNELFYGDQEPVWVVDTAAYPVRRGRVPSYESEKYYSSSRPATASYYREPSYGRQSEYYGDRHSDYDSYGRRSDYYRSSRPSRYADTEYYQRDAYSPDPYHSPPSTAYDDTYYDSKPQEYYDYRRPSTVVLKVPICCESCAEEVRNSLFELRGVRAVYCDVRKERVTVTGTAAPADVLQVVRKLHKKSRFWGDEDYY